MYALINQAGRVVAVFNTADAAIAAKYKKLYYNTYTVEKIATKKEGN